MPEKTGECSHLELLAFQSGTSEMLAYVPLHQDPVLHTGSSQEGVCSLKQAPQHLITWESGFPVL